MNSATPSFSDLPGRLAAEWRQLTLQADLAATVRSWGIGADNLAVALECIGFRYHGQDPATVTPESVANPALRTVLERAATDHLAARTVLERLIPGLLGLARRRRGDEHAFDELVAAAWEVIVSFNPRRAPQNLPATLLRDCEYVAFRRDHRRRRVEIAPIEFDEHTLGAEPQACTGVATDELAELIDEATSAGVLGRRDVELLDNLLADRSSRQTAERMQVCERTVRYQRNDLVNRLRAVALSA